jgi:hypothetical protein
MDCFVASLLAMTHSQRAQQKAAVLANGGLDDCKGNSETQAA